MLAVVWERRRTVVGPPLTTFDIAGCSGEAPDSSRIATPNKETPASRMKKATEEPKLV
jgi:hypothetical protein